MRTLEKRKSLNLTTWFIGMLVVFTPHTYGEDDPLIQGVSKLDPTLQPELEIGASVSTNRIRFEKGDYEQHTVGKLIMKWNGLSERGEYHDLTRIMIVEAGIGYDKTSKEIYELSLKLTPMQEQTLGKNGMRSEYDDTASLITQRYGSTEISINPARNISLKMDFVPYEFEFNSQMAQGADIAVGTVGGSLLGLNYIQNGNLGPEDLEKGLFLRIMGFHAQLNIHVLGQGKDWGIYWSMLKAQIKDFSIPIGNDSEKRGVLIDAYVGTGVTFQISKSVDLQWELKSEYFSSGMRNSSIHPELDHPPDFNSEISQYLTLHIGL